MAEFLNFDEDQETSSNKETSLVRRFWIQGLASGVWQNVTHRDDDKAAFKIVAKLVLGNSFDAARLIESNMSIINGNHGFRHIVTVHDHKEKGLIFETNKPEHDHVFIDDEQQEIQPSLLKAEQEKSQPKQEFLTRQTPLKEVATHQPAPPSTKQETPKKDHSFSENTQEQEEQENEIEKNTPEQLVAHMLEQQLHEIEKKVRSQIESSFSDQVQDGKKTQVSPEKEESSLKKEEKKSIAQVSTDSLKKTEKNTLSLQSDQKILQARQQAHKAIETISQKNALEKEQIKENIVKIEDNVSVMPSQKNNTIHRLTPPLRKKDKKDNHSIAHVFSADIKHDKRLSPPPKSIFLKHYKIEEDDEPDILNIVTQKAPSHTHATQNNKASKSLMSGVVVGLLIIGGSFGLIEPQQIDKVLHKTSYVVDNFFFDSPLENAILQNNPVLVKKHLENGANPNGRDQKGDPLLLLASRKNDITTINLLLQAGASWDVFDKNNKPLLHQIAAEGLHLPLEQFLLFGANPDYVEESGCLTALHYAIRYNHSRVVSLLNEYQASFDVQDNCLKKPEDFAKTQHIKQAIENAKLARLQNEKNHVTAPINSLNKSDVASLTPDDFNASQAQKYPEYEEKIIQAISNNKKDVLLSLLKEKPEWLNLEDLTVFVTNQLGTGYRNITDYAILLGHHQVASLTKNAGVSFSNEILHFAIDHADHTDYKDLLNFFIVA